KIPEAVLADHRQHLLVAVAVVDDDGQSEIDRQRPLLAQDAELLLTRRVIVVEVETALPHRHSFGIRQKGAEAVRIAVNPRRSIMGMDSQSAPDVRMAMTEVEDILRLIQPDRGDEEAA